MKKFTRPQDPGLSRLPADQRAAVENALRTLAEIAPPGRLYRPEDEGYVLLLTPEDTAETVARDLGASPEAAPFEGAWREPGCFIAVLLRDNQFGVTVVVPDAPWLCPKLRKMITDHL